MGHILRLFGPKKARDMQAQREKRGVQYRAFCPFPGVNGESWRWTLGMPVCMAPRKMAGFKKKLNYLEYLIVPMVMFNNKMLERC
jgi:hypothetical protein